MGLTFSLDNDITSAQFKFVTYTAPYGPARLWRMGSEEVGVHCVRKMFSTDRSRRARIRPSPFSVGASTLRPLQYSCWQTLYAVNQFDSVAGRLRRRRRRFCPSRAIDPYSSSNRLYDIATANCHQTAGGQAVSVLAICRSAVPSVSMRRVTGVLCLCEGPWPAVLRSAG